MHEGAVQRIGDARVGFERVRPRVLARPWPLAERFGTEPEASWGAPEVLAHTAEMLPYWLGELERIVDGEHDPVPFGRVADDPVRIGLIGRDRTVPLRVLFDRIDMELGAWSSRLGGLRAADASRRGLHPKLGELTVQDLVERFVVAHVEDHLAQLRRLAGPAGVT